MNQRTTQDLLAERRACVLDGTDHSATDAELKRRRLARTTPHWAMSSNDEMARRLEGVQS